MATLVAIAYPNDPDRAATAAQDLVNLPFAANADLDDAVAVVEWGEGLAERLSDHHLCVTLTREPDSEMRTATWRWNRP